MLIDLRRRDYLARVHPVVRIEDRLQFAERPHDALAEHPRQQLTARLSVTVLARQRTVVRRDEISRAFEEVSVLADPIRIRQAERDARVHAPLTEVAVEARRRF